MPGRGSLTGSSVRIACRSRTHGGRAGRWWHGCWRNYPKAAPDVSDPTATWRRFRCCWSAASPLRRTNLSDPSRTMGVTGEVTKYHRGFARCPSFPDGLPNR